MRKITVVLLCVFIMLQLTGCWNRREPTNLAVMDSILYGINDDKSSYVFADVLNISGDDKAKSSEGGGGGNNVLIEGSGFSIPEAVRGITSSVERKVYVAHNKIRFFDESLAKAGMANAIDFFLRDHEHRQLTYIIIVKGDKPELIYKADMGLASSIGSYFDDIASAQMSSKSDTAFVTTIEFAKNFYLDGKEAVAGVVEILEDKESSEGEGKSEDQASPKYKLKNDGLAVFKKDKLVGYINGVEARAYNFVTNGFEGAFISTFTGENSNIVVEVLTSKSDIKTSIKDDKVEVDLKFKMNLHLAQYGEKQDIDDKEVIKKIEQDFNKKIKEEVASAIKKLQQEFKSDIFGFGLFFHIDNPKQWKEIKNKWNDYFADATINVEVDSMVHAIGDTKNPFVMEED